MDTGFDQHMRRMISEWAVEERVTKAQRIMSEAVWRNVYTMTIRGTDVNGSTIFEEVNFNGPFVPELSAKETCS